MIVLACSAWAWTAYGRLQKERAAATMPPSQNRPHDPLTRIGGDPCRPSHSAPRSCAGRSTTTTISYYVEAKPEISDREFDRLLDELKKLEAEHPELVTPDSPTQRVGGQPIEGFATVTHRVPMLSIDNTYNADELREFDSRVRKLLGKASRSRYVVELKIDGVAMSLTYENGLFTVGATRGDGEQGDDVTHNLQDHPRPAAAAARPTTRRRCSRRAARST